MNSLYRDLGKKKEAPIASLPGCFGLCEISSQEKQNRRPSYCVAGAAPPRAFMLQAGARSATFWGTYIAHMALRLHA